MAQTNMTIQSATRANLQRLIMLRLFIIGSFALVMMVLMQAKLPFQYAPMLASLAALGLMNLIAWWQLKSSTHLHSMSLFLQLLGDIAAFSCLFYFSGGYSNPFIWMYLIPITIAAVALKPIYSWSVAAISTACYTLLMFYHKPLSHLHAHASGLVGNGRQLDIHLVGMWLGFVVSAVIVAIFISKIGKNLRDYDQKIAEAREKSLEAERLLALGAQAASAAHELGTPLATMNLITQDLIETHQSNPALAAPLNTVHKQIKRCKEILSSMTDAAGMARAESIQHISLKAFVASAIERWQDTRPAVSLTIDVQADGDNPMIIMDSTLTRTILNVLDNAADASPDQVELSARWSRKQLTINVRDFGEGLSAESKRKLGNLFFTSKADDGLGLGVYLSQLTLARYEGELSIENHPDGGANTLIKLPLTPLLATQDE